MSTLREDETRKSLPESSRIPQLLQSHAPPPQPRYREHLTDMNFTESRPGVWFDDSQQYRISKATIVKRRNGEPLFYAAILCEQIGKPEQQFWACCGAQRPHNSMKAALRAVRKHRRLWVSAIRASRRKLDREVNLERIRLRGHLGVDRTHNYVFSSLPVWVREKAPFAPERIIPGYKKLCAKSKVTGKSLPKVPSGLIGISPSSAPAEPAAPADSNLASPSIRASRAAVEVGATTRTTRRTRSKATNTETPLSAVPATVPEKAAAKRASRHTGKSSTNGARMSRSSKRKSSIGGMPSPN